MPAFAVTTDLVTVVSAPEDSEVNPGLLGFVVVALLGVATWLLIRSMQRRLKNVNFDERREPEDRGGAAHEAHDGRPQPEVHDQRDEPHGRPPGGGPAGPADPR